MPTPHLVLADSGLPIVCFRIADSITNYIGDNDPDCSYLPQRICPTYQTGWPHMLPTCSSNGLAFTQALGWALSSGACHSMCLRHAAQASTKGLAQSGPSFGGRRWGSRGKCRGHPGGGCLGTAGTESTEPRTAPPVHSLPPRFVDITRLPTHTASQRSQVISCLCHHCRPASLIQLCFLLIPHRKEYASIHVCGN